DQRARSGVGVPAATAGVDGIRATGSRVSVSPCEGRPEATTSPQADNGGAEGHLAVQFVAAARAGSPYLGRDHALCIECLHLQLATIIEVEGLSGPSFVGGVLIGHFGSRRTGGIVHPLRHPSSGQAFPNT